MLFQNIYGYNIATRIDCILVHRVSGPVLHTESVFADILH